MGVSTDGIAFFGVDFGERYSTKLSDLFDQYYDKEKNPVFVGMHCHSENPMYYVATWELVAWRGSPKRLTWPSKEKRAADTLLIEAFLQEHGLKTKRKPKLWLCSLWS